MGVNYVYQDQMFIILTITPVGTGSSFNGIT